MKTAVFHSVNSSLYIWGAQTGLLIDGIHRGAEQGFSPMPIAWTEDIKHHRGFFAHINGLLFTHLHGDHFDAGALKIVLSSPTPPLVYGPGVVSATAQATEVFPNLKHLCIGSAHIFALTTPHDGAAFRFVPHESFLIHLDGEYLFVAGDAQLSARQADLLRSYCSAVDAAFLNLYHLASPDGQEFLHVLDPKRVFLYHLPFPEDDQYRVYSMARFLLRNYPNNLPVPEALQHMAWLDDHPSVWFASQIGG